MAATSANNAWAVGYEYNNSTADQTVIEHWNGKVWSVQPSPNPGGSGNDNQLNGVSAVSPTDAWAVGSYYNGTSNQTLIEHWNGKAWKAQPSPSFAGPLTRNRKRLGRGPIFTLSSVVAVSSSDAWAVGYRSTATAFRTLIEHWNGKRWKVQPSPNPGGSGNDNELAGVTATSAKNAWAVGDYVTSSTSPDLTLVEHWNGKSWKVQSSPSPGGSSSPSYLNGVAATSRDGAWAVGEYGQQRAASERPDPAFVEDWNGKAWKVQPILNPGTSALNGVAASSPSNVWAVGFYDNGTTERALALHGG